MALNAQDEPRGEEESNGDACKGQFHRHSHSLRHVLDRRNEEETAADAAALKWTEFNTCNVWILFLSILLRGFLSLGQYYCTFASWRENSASEQFRRMHNQ